MSTTIQKLFITPIAYLTLNFCSSILLFAPRASAQACYPVTHAAEDLQQLNQFWGTRVRLCRLPAGAKNAIAYPDRSLVVADQDWLDNIAYRYGNWAATGILAHEWGHIVQGSRVSGTAAELQADCLAGVFMKGVGLPWPTVEQFARSNFVAGDPYWTSHGHGTGIQRVNAARRGYYGFSGQTGRYLVNLCPPSAF